MESGKPFKGRHLWAKKDFVGRGLNLLFAR